MKIPKAKSEVVNQNRQTIQWPKEKRQKYNNDLQNINQKSNDRVKRTALKTCACDTRHVIVELVRAHDAYV